MVFANLKLISECVHIYTTFLWFKIKCFSYNFLKFSNTFSLRQSEIKRRGQKQQNDFKSTPFFRKDEIVVSPMIVRSLQKTHELVGNSISFHVMYNMLG